MLESTPSNNDAKKAVITFAAFAFDWFFASQPATPTRDAGVATIDIKQRLYTKQESSEYLSISVRTIENLMAEGKLRPVYLGKRNVRFLLEELDAYAESLPKDSSE